VGVVTRSLLAVCALALPVAAGAECVTRSMRITFYTCAEGSPQCLTKQGNQPLAFRTVAVGDRRLLGRWLYIQDLGGWVLASDTGGALKPHMIDVFIGDSRMAPHARRLGVQHWDVRVCGLESPSAKAGTAPAAAKVAPDEARVASADPGHANR
jgi:3D (Asp-Asp-Asp) domain-containing protein